MLAGCATPEAVRDFTSAAAEAVAQFPPLVRDIPASCIRKQLADRPFNEIADVTPQVNDACKEFSDLQPNLLGAMTVLSNYFNALNQLASDSTVTYGKEIDDFAGTVQGVGKFTDKEVTAVKGLAKFLFDAVASGYQRRKLGNALKQADNDVAILTTDWARLLEATMIAFCGRRDSHSLNATGPPFRQIRTRARNSLSKNTGVSTLPR